MEEVVVSGVALNTSEAKVTIFKVPDQPGVASKIFKRLADSNINVDMIIQNKTETRSTDISFTVAKGALPKTLKAVRAAAHSVGAKHVSCDEDVAKISVVGVGMRSHSGVASKMFGALAKRRINIEMISTSEIKISCVIEGERGKEAVRAIHKEFGLGKK